MSRWVKIHMWPVWVVGVFGQAKSFRDNPLLGSRLLNRLGLHVLRVVMARLASRIKWLLLSPLLPGSLRRDFHQNGFIIIPDFIGPAMIQAILSETKYLPDDARQMIQGDTLTQKILLDRPSLSRTPRLREIAGSSRFLNPLYYCGAKWHHPILYLQRIRNGQTHGGDDPQKTMHSDAFHPSIKAWLFLEDVPMEKGPFTYVRGSNRLTLKRLKWEYRQSLMGPDRMNTYAARGSLRALAEDLDEMGLPAPESLCVKAGTLVIANTNGFHGRGAAKEGASRLEIWAYGRYNPFNPFPGFPLKALHALENRVLRRYYTYNDARAKKKGARPSWHRIPRDEMLD